MGFAPSINYIGYEDIRFSSGWSDATNQEFWTYCFVWCIEKNSTMTIDKLTQYINCYYDGLMGISDHNKRDTAQLNQMDKTISLFVKSDLGFSGEIKTYDRFFTKDYITFNINIKDYFCPKKQTNY